MTKVLASRFEELERRADDIASNQTQRPGFLGEGTLTDIDGDQLLEWRLNAKNLLALACGESSVHYEEFGKHGGASYEIYSSTLKSLRAVLRAAEDDFNSGLMRSSRSLVQAELFDSELEQATELLRGGYLSAAAVIAGVVLETTLRELCTDRSLDLANLNKMNANLAKAGAYNKLVAKNVTAWAGIRNAAAHGNPPDFTKSDVEAMVSGVSDFVERNLPS